MSSSKNSHLKSVDIVQTPAADDAGIEKLGPSGIRTQQQTQTTRCQVLGVSANIQLTQH